MSIALRYRIEEKVANTFNYIRIFESKTGIKMINSITKNEWLSHSEPFYLEGGNLYLGFDALNDEYTLCGVNLLNSPHFDLMKKLESNEDIKHSDYCNRFATGALDGRYPVIVNNAEIERLKKYFEVRKKEILDGIVRPVQVYRIKNKYYIADGKHRAALTVLLGEKVCCIEINNDFLKDSCRMWILQVMRKKQKLYSKNVQLFDDLRKI